MANFRATTNVDTINQSGNSDDNIRFSNTNRANAGDRFNMSGGTDTIVISSGASVDLTAVGSAGGTSGFYSIEGLRFGGAGSATLSQAQFGASRIVDTGFAVTATTGTQDLTINDVTRLDARSWTFNSWASGTDLFTLNGTSGNDQYYGASVHSQLNGGEGNDRIHAGSGGATLNGGDGDDHMFGGAGADAMDGGTGTNRASYYYSTAAVTVDLDNLALNTGDAAGDTYTNIQSYAGSEVGNDFIYGSDSGDDILYGRGGNDRLEGRGGNDRLVGDAGDDTLVGGEGGDTLIGGFGSDTLEGGGGGDFLYGGDDNDTLTGSTGRDVLQGGAGNDTIVFLAETDSGVTGATRDVIRGFVSGEDTIDLGAIDAVTGGGDDAFTFIGTGAFSGTAGELRYHATANGVILSVDVNGDTIADMQISVQGITTLSAGDLLL